MANVSVIKLKVRRGTDVQRKLITLDTGEIGYTTDSKRLFVGDGSTIGGLGAGMKFYSGVISTAAAGDGNISTVQTGDIVYDTTLSQFYVLTGAPSRYADTTAYRVFGLVNTTTVNTNVSAATQLSITGPLTAYALSARTTNTPALTTSNVVIFGGAPNSAPGIGSPSVFIGEVGDGSSFTTSSVTSGFNIVYDETNNRLVTAMQGFSNSLTAIVVDVNNRIGINTLTPTASLTIQGDLSSSNNIYGANLSASNTVYGRNLSASNTVYGANLSASNTITGKSLSANSNIYANGNVFGGTNINTVPGNSTSYTLQLSDNGGTIASINGTAAGSLTVYANNAGYPVGFQTAVIQLSTAQVVLSGNGFTLNQANAFTKTSKQYSAATLIYTGTIGGWVVFGDVSA
jgi:Major tropism determinant N-terminal domain